MLIVHVHVHVKPEYVQAFRQATIDRIETDFRFVFTGHCSGGSLPALWRTALEKFGESSQAFR